VKKRNKEKFWQKMNNILQEISGNKDAVINGDKNKHFGSERGGYGKIKA